MLALLAAQTFKYASKKYILSYCSFRFDISKVIDTVELSHVRSPRENYTPDDLEPFCLNIILPKLFRCCIIITKVKIIAKIPIDTPITIIYQPIV